MHNQLIANFWIWTF